MGAGLALTSKSARAQVSSAAAPALDHANRLLTRATAQARSSFADVNETAASLQGSAMDMLGAVQDQAGNFAGDISTRATDAAKTATGHVTGTIDAAKGAVGQAREAVSVTIDGVRSYGTVAPEKARALISDNAALIGGLGIAIGAVIAAALPKTEVEAKAMGGASDSVKQAAKEATETGFAAIKDKTLSAVDAAQKSVADADLGSHAARMTENIAGAVKDAAEDAAAAAFNPTHTPNV
jgi:uncharacterized protein YjbJ (UPF0337 family)